jgi:hypothetical protein
LIPASTNTPSATLLGARDDIAKFVDTLGRAGADKGGLTDEQIANAIINQATGEGIPEEGIILLAGDSEELLPLFESLYVISTSTCPEIYLDYEMGFIIKDLNTVEISLGFAEYFESFDGTILEGLVMGLNLKYIMGETAYRRLNISETSDMQNSDYELMPEGNKCQSSAVGIDIGFLYDKKEDWRTRIALSFTNINTPSFKPPPTAEPYGEKFELNPTGKLGVAFWPTDFLTIAADIDLIKAPTFLKDFYCQMLSAGTEIYLLDNLPNYSLILRGGIRKNVTASYDSTMYSIGIGVTLMAVTLDLGFAYGPVGIPMEQAPGGDISNTLSLLNFDYFPDNWQLAAGFSFKFGGKKDKSKSKNKSKRRRRRGRGRRRYPDEYEYYDYDDYYYDDYEY